MARRLIVIALVAQGLVFAVSAAQADTEQIIEEQHHPATAADGWQAGTCSEDEAEKCSPETPELFFNQAGGHPPFGFTQYTLRHKTFVPDTIEEPLAEIKTLRSDLPPGLTVNPEATERCPLETFEEDVTKCPPSSEVGREEATVVLRFEIPNPNPPPTTLPKNFVIHPSEERKTLVPIFNLVPNKGEPALFGFKIGPTEEEEFLTTEVAWESDYHESFTIVTPPPSATTKTLRSRLVNIGTSGNGTYITNPTTCFSPELPPFQQAYSTFFRAESREEPDPVFPSGRTPVEAALPEGLVQVGCAKVPFDPTLGVSAGTDQVDSPAGPTINTELPFIAGAETLSESHLRNATIAMPTGMGLNPSAANGLAACTDAQFGKGTRDKVACPDASKIGTVEIETPPLPKGALKGDVFLGQQLSRDPTSGEEFRIFVDAESERYGISSRLIGNTSADPKTGQLTTRFTENPQVPFTSVKINLDGAKGVLSSPPTCSPATTTGTFEPWSTPASTRSRTSEFTLSTAPGGGSCPTTLAERPFAPSYTAKSDNSKGGAYSPFRVHIGRPDGQQELKLVDATLAKGLAGKLAGIPYCSEDALAAAAANSGVTEQASPSCPAASEIGSVSTEAGTGSNPLKIGGKAYLAGPYKGAPLSMAVITPAVAGPFDLGTVVVRVALFVDPSTAQVRTLSDPIPDVFGGVKLDLRSIDFNVDRSKFTHNPTNCSVGAVSGTLGGGGSDPTDPAAFSSYPFSVPYQATACKKLGFKPKLHTRLFGGPGTTTRAKHPQLRAILEAREGDANVLRSALTLPRAMFLDQGHIRTVCTRPQLASQTCPKAAVYGHAQARSPLLGNPLRGPVYLVSSSHELPDLVADLRGQVNVQLHGIISSVKGGGIKTVFNPLPDAPVSKFILRMEGGDKGLLVNSRNLCRGPLSSVMNLKAQNGKKVRNNHLPLRVSGCGGK
jgi:hypothetical protein